jgi:integrase
MAGLLVSQEIRHLGENEPMNARVPALYRFPAEIPEAWQFDRPRGAGVALLNPTQLSKEAELASEELMNHRADNTITAVKSSIRYWAGWFRIRYGRPLEAPVHPATVRQFVLDHVGEKSPDGKSLVSCMPQQIDEALCESGHKAKPGLLKLSTVELRLNMLATAHRLKGMPSPVNDDVKAMMRGARRLYGKLGKKESVGQDALDLEHLRAILATCDDSPLGIRDAAMLSFAFNSGGRRRSEVVNADLSALMEDGANFKYLLGPNKSDQSGENTAPKPVQGQAAEAMRRWLAVRGRAEGRLFCFVDPDNGPILERRVTEAAFRLMVIKRAKLAGFVGKRFGAHALRVGFITELGRRRMSIPEGMRLTGHKSEAMFLHYYRQAKDLSAPEADLMSLE